MEKNHAQTTEAVAAWWNEHPFAFGVANTKRDQVGTIALEEMDLEYFETVERKFRKHHRGGAQEDGAPLFSKLVDRSWLKNKFILDIAVGSGFSLVSFADVTDRIIGIDITPFAVAHAKKNLKVRGLSGEVLQMDAQDMQFSDSVFDFVNAWGCLMHMPDTKGAIGEIHRVLKPQGRTLAYMYNKRSWPYWFNIIFVRGILMLGLVRYRFDTVRLSSRYSDGASVGGNQLTKFYTAEEVETMFREKGFSKVKAFPLDLPEEPNHWPMRRVPLFKYLPKSIKAFMSKRWGYGLIVQAEK